MQIGNSNLGCTYEINLTSSKKIILRWLFLELPCIAVFALKNIYTNYLIYFHYNEFFKLGVCGYAAAYFNIIDI